MHVCIVQGRGDTGKKGGKISYLFRERKNNRLFRPSLMTFSNMKFYHLSSLYLLSRVHAHLPRHGKKFYAKKRRICIGHLGVINLCGFFENVEHGGGEQNTAHQLTGLTH